MLPDGRLQRRAEREVVPFVYAGAAILSPALFAGAPAGAFPLTLLFDRAGEREPAVRPAPRRPLDARRHAGGGRSRRSGARRGDVESATHAVIPPTRDP